MRFARFYNLNPVLLVFVTFEKQLFIVFLLNKLFCNSSKYSIAYTLLEINGITLIKKWYNPVAPWYTIYGITN